MTQLARLYIQGLRNIDEADIAPSPFINLIVGENGSGKTSVLEAIYMLGTGKSFRSHLQRPIIQEGGASCTIFGELESRLALGVQRNRYGGQTIKIGGQIAESTAQLSQSLPVILLNGDSFMILEGGPSDRRRFLDWGVFHVKHEFQYHWKSARRALRHRNQLLKQEAATMELEPWTKALAIHGEAMSGYREEYFKELQHHLAPLLEMLLGNQLGSTFSMSFERGWTNPGELLLELTERLDRDRKAGYTSVGPHRADIKFCLDKQEAANVFSRGQMKLLISALKLAQIRLLEERAQTTCIVLIDDLQAELDLPNLMRVCDQLALLKQQIFMACIDTEPLRRAFRSGLASDKRVRMFHVKRGNIYESVQEQ